MENGRIYSKWLIANYISALDRIEFIQEVQF